MITLKDIETAVAGRLKSAGHTVTAAEVDEGFSKPTFFIDVFQNSATLENQFMQLVVVSVELRYFPADETREAQIEMADELRELFLPNMLAVNDRFLSVQEMVFETDSTALLCTFSLEFMQEIGAAEKEYEKMKDLQMEVKLSYGTSSGSD